MCYYPNDESSDDPANGECVSISGETSICCALNHTNPYGGVASDGLRADAFMENGLCKNVLTTTDDDDQEIIVTAYWRDLCTSSNWRVRIVWITDSAVTIAPILGALASSTVSVSTSSLTSMLTVSATSIDDATLELTSQPTSQSTSSASSDSGLSTGAKAGIGAGVGVGAVAIIAGIAFVFFVRRRKPGAACRCSWYWRFCTCPSLRPELGICTDIWIRTYIPLCSGGLSTAPSLCRKR
ncbi:uncharacterized protein BDV17DRAFT_294623 [Aspergillus undulatus]|uniref:uncharacterized protein n=1 Tax=Aspergillus undulatus TaxID=1810928 RepID=UPI003CCDAE14